MLRNLLQPFSLYVNRGAGVSVGLVSISFALHGRTLVIPALLSRMLCRGRLHALLPPELCARISSFQKMTRILSHCTFSKCKITGGRVETKGVCAGQRWGGGAVTSNAVKEETTLKWNRDLSCVRSVYSGPLSFCLTDQVTATCTCQWCRCANVRYS